MGEGHEACGLASLQACAGGEGGARQSMWRSITWGRREEEGGGRSDGGRDGEGDGGVC